MRIRARWVVACIGMVALIGATIDIGHSAKSAPLLVSAGPDFAHSDQRWDDLFQAYGNTSDAWSGGDGAQPLLLPDGSTVWFFADTFLGKTYSNGSRQVSTSGGAHNSAVLYRNGRLGPTFSFLPGSAGYNSMQDYTWVLPPPGFNNFQYEVLNGDQVIVDGTVYKFFQLADKTIHPGGFTYKLVGTDIETFSIDRKTDVLTPTGGTPVQVQDSVSSNPIIWGEATLVSGGYIYIYGVRPYNGKADPFPLYVARVTVQGLRSGAPWQYYHGTPSCSPPAGTWRASPAQATPLMNGVSAEYSVTNVNGMYVLLTSDNTSLGTEQNAIAYYAPCPTDFSPGSPRYPVFQPHLPRHYLAYAYQIVPQFSNGSEVLVSYSIDTVKLAQNFGNVSIYRPRFLDVKLPGIAGPSGHVTEPPP